MPRSLARSYDLIDTALEGQLDRRLRAWHAEGLGVRQIASALADLGYPVGRDTVRRWLHEIGVFAG